jgi:hypothetical protein
MNEGNEGFGVERNPCDPLSSIQDPQQESIMKLKKRPRVPMEADENGPK